MLKIIKENSEEIAPRKKKVASKQKLSFHLPGNKVHFVSLGCPRNLVDTEVMMGILLKNGYEAIGEMKKADYIVINTCGFLKASRDESISVIDEAIREKKTKAKVIVTGCMVQKHSEEVKTACPQVDYMLGSGDVEGILKAVESETPHQEITDARSYLEMGEVPRMVSTPAHFAYLKIAEGCRKRCSYCIIPDIKGPLRSKSFEQVLKEFRSLRKQGIKEIILIAQDLGDYGKDLGFVRTEGLIALIKQLSQEEGDFWLRLMYLYPDEITDELITEIKKDPRICPYIDMPIQHVNDELLLSMRRKVNRQKIIEVIQKLRVQLPNISIRTSLIVGFPGETEAQFTELCQFIPEYPIDHVGIFCYSNEPDSHSASLPNHIPEEEKVARQEKLAAIQQKVVEKLLSTKVGQTLRMVVEGYHPETNLLMVARHQGQAPEIDGIVLINDGRKVQAFGEFYDVKITGVAGYDLLGTVVGKSKKS